MGYEKTLKLEHRGMRAMLPEVKRNAGADLDVRDFFPSGNDVLDRWRLRRFREYQSYGFPVWRRVGLTSFEPPRVEGYRGLENIDEEGLALLEELDFEGSDRKFVLMADVFSMAGEYVVVSSPQEKVVVEVDQDVANSLLDLRGGDLTLVRIVRRERFVGNLRVKVREKARFKLVNLHLVGKGGTSIDNVFLDVETGASVEVYDFYSGGRVNVGFLAVRFSGEDATAKVRPYYAVSSGSATDVLYQMRFYGRRNEGTVDSKGVVTGESKVVFRGVLDILPGAKDTVAHQRNHTFLLSESAKAEAIPSLFVGENDVVASHAHSSSPLDETAVFYLMTRGCSETEARELLIKGTFEDLREELRNFELEAVLDHALEGLV